jgi:hypothetical protein
MFDISAVDISSVVGLTAMVLLTLNILMGLLVSTNYNPAKQWPNHKLPWPLLQERGAQLRPGRMPALQWHRNLPDL